MQIFQKPILSNKTHILYRYVINNRNLYRLLYYKERVLDKQGCKHYLLTALRLDILPPLNHIEKFTSLIAVGAERNT